MWSLGLLSFSWLFLQTISSAHFSRGMSNDRPVEQMSAPLYHNYDKIDIRLNFTAMAGRRAKYWRQADTRNSQLLHPLSSELQSDKAHFVSGVLVITKLYGSSDACSPVRYPGRRAWIALVMDGGCNYKEKVENVFQRSNASGLIVYGEEGQMSAKDARSHIGAAGSGAAGLSLGHQVKSSKRGSGRAVPLGVWVKHGFLADVQTRCNATFPCNATLMVTVSNPDSLINRTSVLFVSISFILLMIISLAWLVFYYVQRFRYIHAKERLSRRLANAAKKALTKIPVKTLLRGDQETENEYDQCAVCIEQYKPSDTIRILPCRHYFHKSCIDPWLLEQRSCPMCKLDILKAYGLQVRGFSEGPSDTMVEHSEVHPLAGGTTSVSLEAGGVPDSPTGGAGSPSVSCAEGPVPAVVIVESPLSGVGSGCESCGAGGGIRVTIEPPGVLYHTHQPLRHGGSASSSSSGNGSGHGVSGSGEAPTHCPLEVRVEQHGLPPPPPPLAPPAEFEDDEDEEEAIARPLVAGRLSTAEYCGTEC